ncbi:hypothetical protein ILUMI_15424 [Ignelater luminosus]|uniref:Uncharacterized protein n=1 Tax=Ignelater luminosus TaxID=2038154 RepID=A0A8K0CQI7_IGNLU|nr:hypothetical protein ILUMI_15424 [Ignelater luminosus]
MNNFVLFVLFVIVIIACPSLCLDNSKDARILSYENDNIGLAGYNFKFETSDGILREEHGEISDPESDNAILRVRGSYSYITPDGRMFTVRYTADDQGYRPEISVSDDSFDLGDRVGTPVIISLQAGNAVG